VQTYNSPTGYGALTKTLHWLVAALFAFQFVAGHIMVRLPANTTQLGLGPDTWFNWHKSIGLVALVVAVVRLWNRRQGQLPPWAPSLTAAERHFIHRAEQALYAAMLVMPLSGFVYVMAGGYGVLLFGAWPLPNMIGSAPVLAAVAKWLHIGAGWLLAAALAGHIGLVLRHQVWLRDGLLRRML
jgi:cytochrome b561